MDMRHACNFGPRWRVALARAGPVAGLLWILTSCEAPRPPRLVTDPDPAVKIPAIRQVIRKHDLSAVPQLIKDLDNDDPAVRLYAGNALEQLTGQQFGYQYFASEERRVVAIKQWRQWFAAQPESDGPEAPAINVNAGP